MSWIWRIILTSLTFPLVWRPLQMLRAATDVYNNSKSIRYSKYIMSYAVNVNILLIWTPKCNRWFDYHQLILILTTIFGRFLWCNMWCMQVEAAPPSKVRINCLKHGANVNCMQHTAALLFRIYLFLTNSHVWYARIPGSLQSTRLKPPEEP